MIYIHLNNCDDITDVLKIIRADDGDSICFCGWQPGSIPLTDFIKIIEQLPSNVKTVFLDDNNLGKLGARLGLLLEAVPDSVDFLDLANNSLHELGPDLPDALVNIPETVTSLMLGANGLGKLSAEHVEQALRSIYDKVTLLDLSNNELSASTLARADFRYWLPYKLSQLDLSNNQLGRLPDDAFISCLDNISGDITHLELRNNDFDKLSSVGLTALFSKMPHVKILDLDHNDFIMVTDADLSTAFAAISYEEQPVHLVDAKFSPHQLQIIIKALAARKDEPDASERPQRNATLAMLAQYGTAIPDGKLSDEMMRSAIQAAATLTGLSEIQLTCTPPAHDSSAGGGDAAEIPDGTDQVEIEAAKCRSISRTRTMFTRPHDRTDGNSSGGGAAERSGSKHQRDASDDQSTDPKDKRPKSSP